jgi:hypothetical protein
MRYWTSALALLAASGTAAAQVPPAPEEPPPPAPTDPAPPAPPAPTPPPQPVEREELRPPPPPPPLPSPTATERRPSELSFAIGLGYQLPTSLQTPNITSVRLRLASGITFEPRLVLAKSTRDVDTGPSTTDDASEIGIGALARFPLAQRRRVDLELLGGVNVNREQSSPESGDEDLSITTLTATYGLAVGAWINRHCQVSLSALNPIVTNIRRDEQMGPGTSTVTTTRTFGLIFEPSVALMLHLYH